MHLAIFDLDNTLIGGDSDYLWGEYLIEIGVVSEQRYRQQNIDFYRQYQNGTLDIHEFLAFQLQPLAQHPPAHLLRWRSEFIEHKIKPIVLLKAQELVRKHRENGHQLLIITATNRFITEPIAGLFGIEHLLATEPEFQGNRYTGRVEGIPCFAQGKVIRLREWLSSQALERMESWFYTDSHNDLPLLSSVTHPVAVDPDERLRREALARNWPILGLR